MQVYISLKDYKQDHFKGWIGKVASNKSLGWLRRRKTKFREEASDRIEEAYPSAQTGPKKPCRKC